MVTSYFPLLSLVTQLHSRASVTLMAGSGRFSQHLDYPSPDYCTAHRVTVGDSPRQRNRAKEFTKLAANSTTRVF